MRVYRLCQIGFLSFGIVVAFSIAGLKAEETEQLERTWLHSLNDLENWEHTETETKVSLFPVGRPKLMSSLRFANKVDFKDGDYINELIGWPRVWLSLDKTELTDWSKYDFVEFYVYTESTRKKLPFEPLQVGFYHGDDEETKGSTPYWLNEIKLNQWVKFQFPISKLKYPNDVSRVQFSIAEKHYTHGDGIDFYISPPTLVRHTGHTFAKIDFEKSVLYSNDPRFVVQYQIQGPQPIKSLQVEVTIIDAGNKAHGLVREEATPSGELTLRLSGKLKSGKYSVRLRLKDDQRKLLDEKTRPIRVISGPF